MTIKIDYNVEKPQFSRSEDYLLLSLYINRLTTEKLPTKRILETIDSSVRKTGEVEYDTQNCLRHHKSHAWPKNSKWDSLPYINRSMTKYFLIERIQERTDSSIKNLGEVEYDKQNWLKAELATIYVKWQ